MKTNYENEISKVRCEANNIEISKVRCEANNIHIYNLNDFYNLAQTVMHSTPAQYPKVVCCLAWEGGSWALMSHKHLYYILKQEVHTQ